MRSTPLVVAAFPALFALFFLPATVEAREPAPLVVAVDTSRSLSPAALEDVVSRLRPALADLPADTPTALLAFDDEPRWIVELGAAPSEVASALSDLSPKGSYTLLNDALFFATRALPQGGVVLLVTDGRDENSAVLVDDIARRSEEQNVRIVAVGMGGAVQERALRRLALVTNGAYLGRAQDVTAGDLAQRAKADLGEVEEARRSAPAPASRRSPDGDANAAAGGERNRAQGSQAAEPGAGSRTAQGPASGQRVSAGQGASTPAGAAPLWKNPLVLGAALLLLGLLIFLARGRRQDPLDHDDVHDEEREKLDQAAADEAEAGMIRLELAQTEAAQSQEAPEVTVDTAVFQQRSLEERLERTQVLQNHSMLVMRKLGERPRTFLLGSEKAFAVGRDRHKNTLAVPDPALSSQHFKIVPREDTQYFVDLESTNGSYVNGRRVAAKRLRHGDMIRSGQVEFEYQSYSNV